MKLKRIEKTSKYIEENNQQKTEISYLGKRSYSKGVDKTISFI